MDADQRAYFRLRAEEEQQMAQDAAGIEAKRAHETLADRYRRLADDAAAAQMSG